MKKLTNLVTNIKNKIKNIKDKVLAIFKAIIGDKIDVAVLVIGVILSVIDLVSGWKLTGAIALLTLYILGLLIRLALWKIKK